ncbi:hypothetical protein NQ315_017278 [Exocentrus adspersus]|uniref:Maturase K n=1 Tax=Exocentrus adspersus TaxID=1586481 RepID=A0AAV8V8T5_9CUCU|nr:hypothetical protein NQ315_017278 [Exocentrus adspersus]
MLRLENLVYYIPKSRSELLFTEKYYVLMRHVAPKDIIFEFLNRGEYRFSNKLWNSTIFRNRIQEINISVLALKPIIRSIHKYSSFTEVVMVCL